MEHQRAVHKKKMNDEKITRKILLKEFIVNKRVVTDEKQGEVIMVTWEKH